MLSSSAFFKLFPPPVFMLMPHAGLDVSDDALRCLAYEGFASGRKLAVFAAADLPQGLVEGGDIKDEKEFVSRLADFGKANGLYYVKVSIPEEKAYLFHTEVPDMELSAIHENIEFKLEENVPLSAADAVFYFDLLPSSATGGALTASVSVVPKSYIERYMSLLSKAGLVPVAFEIAPKSIARAVVPSGTSDSKLIVHVMSKKTGIYVVSGGVVSFASTIGLGSGETDPGLRAEAATALSKEITRIYAYWPSHGTGRPIDETVLAGKGASMFEAACKQAESETPVTVRIADIWRNAFDLESYVPPIKKADSLEYAVAAGLALDTPYEA